MSSYTKESKKVIKFSEPGYIKVKVIAKDLNGNTSQTLKNITVKNNTHRVLAMSSSISTSNIVEKNTNIVIRSSGTGGIQPYRFAFKYRVNSGEWKLIRVLSSTSTVTLKAKETGTYSILTTIRDESGTEKNKALSVKVVDKPDETDISQQDNIDYGHSLNYQIPDAGDGAVYEVFSKMPDSSEWVKIQPYNTNRSFVFRPRYPGVTTYLIHSKLNGKVITSYYAVNASVPDVVYEELAIINEERQKVGVAPLKLDMDLQYIANIRAEELESNYDHIRPDGSQWYTIYDEMGIHAPVHVAENISWGYHTPSDVILGWMYSTGHREKMLSSTFDRVGLGIYKKFWLQSFGG